MIDRIDTISLQVSDVEKASKWYQELLSLKESYIGESYRALSIGSSEMPLTLEEGIMNIETRTYPIFFTKDIQSAYENLQNKGVEVSEIEHDEPNHFFTFLDRDNNKLQICHWK